MCVSGLGEFGEDPSGVGAAVGRGVSSEGWILAKPKKIPVKPS